MSLPRAGVRSDFRRFAELNSELDELEEEFSALKLSLPLQLGDLKNLDTKATNLVDAINEIATNLVDAINELLMQIKEKTSYGVVSGLTVTAQDEPDMSVNVSSGIIYMQDGERFEVEADTVAVAEADADNPRIDIIYINGTGLVSYMPGVAAEQPTAPETPSSSQLLAEIAVAANATAIETANITDKRKLLDELEEEFSALKLSLPLQLGDLKNLDTIATNLVDAINELLTQIKEKTSYGVVSGLTVTAQDTPDMTVNVSSGIIYMQNGDRFEVDTDVITIDTADTTNARKDIIYVNSTGEITYLAGTAAEVPEAPSTPTGGLILAEIAVAANTTAIETSNITDKKKSILN